MIEDNTPTKKPKFSPHMRLRLDKARDARRKADKTKSVKVKKSASQQHSSGDQIKSREPRVKQGVLKKPARPKAKFRKRQIHKAWLPTHLFHAKRAHMTPPKEPLWRMAIPLTPTAKSYRPTHRASCSRSAVAWDVSYMSTIGLEGPELSISNLLRAIGVYHEVEKDSKRVDVVRWNAGTRSWYGWLYEKEGWPSKAIAPATVIRCRSLSYDPAGGDVGNDSKPAQRKKKAKSKAFVRVHPSAFLRVWEEILGLSKVQKPAVAVEDLRFEIGSIEIAGPASAEALTGALWPAQRGGVGDATEHSPEAIWPQLRAVSSPGNLPAGSLLGFDITDPRLHHPPRTMALSTTPESQRNLTRILAKWPIDRTQRSPSLFDRASRFSAARAMPSQKAINRRKALASPGTYPAPSKKDPAIPIFLLANNHSSQGTRSWTVLLPWKCMLPVWYSAMYYPLFSGGTIRFGGLNEIRQVTYEAGNPWFPGDYPGTRAGMSWELKEREKRKKDWEKKPRGKRVEWESLDLGDNRRGEIGLGWACDWDRLVHGHERMGEDTAKIYHMHRRHALEKLKAAAGDSVREERALVTARVTLIMKGVPTTCARIYRLPTSDEDLRRSWLSQLPYQSSMKASKARKVHIARPAKDAPPHARRQYLATTLLNSATASNAGGHGYPVVPDEQDLIGFVTTGNFNLAEGKGIAIGNVLLDRLVDRAQSGAPASKTTSSSKTIQTQLCIVRNAGQSIGRLARMELV